jgi:hypothetical protein
MKRLALALLVAAGCAGNAKVVSLAEPAVAPSTKNYVDEIKAWSRHGDMLHDFDATMIVDATMHSPEFHAAYVAKYLEVYKVGDSTRAAAVAAIPYSSESYEFHIETQTHTWEINELKPPRSLWRVTLIDDRGREVTASLVKAEKTRPEFLQIFYPYSNLWGKPWRVLFPRVLNDGTPLVTPDTKTLTLRIAGPPGNIDLLWRLK